jgi:subfamily B ATP-binding cassette protein MsbA
VIEGGQITEIGTHEELMKHSGTYQRLYRMQFSVEDPVPVSNGEVSLTANLEGIA